MFWVIITTKLVANSGKIDQNNMQATYCNKAFNWR